MTKSDVKKGPDSKGITHGPAEDGKKSARSRPALAKVTRGAGVPGRPATAAVATAATALSPGLARAPSAKPKPSTKAKSAIRDDIDSLLDLLDESALHHVLDAARLYCYDMELARKQAEATEGGRFLPDLEAGAMRIERSVDGATYHLIVGRVWKMLVAEEIAALLRIVRHTENEAGAAKRLFQWFHQERRDIVADLEIAGPGSESLFLILRLLKETFPVKSPRRLP